MICIALLSVVLLAEPSSLAAASAHLDAGQVDEVLFDLQGQKFESAKDQRTAARLLAEGASRSLAANDDLMALQLAQMALGYEKANAGANEIAARASLKQQQFADAEKYADGWVAVTKSADAKLFRAQLALDQADWDKALATLKDGAFTGAQAEQAELIRKRAKSERDAQKGAMSEVKALEAAMIKAAAEAKSLKAAPTEVRRSDEVIVYTTAWCGFCRRVKAWLNERKVAFVEKDIERDPAAAPELARKMAQQRIKQQGGVPWTDVRGVLVRGFDPPKLEAALQR